MGMNPFEERGIPLERQIRQAPLGRAVQRSIQTSCMRP
jgi:hypothetical protein